MNYSHQPLIARFKPILSSGHTGLAIFLLFIGLCSFIYTATKGLQSIEQIDLHNQASRQALQNTILIGETMSLLKDIETGQRGFMITGDEAYLLPYKHAHNLIDQTNKKLKASLTEERADGYSQTRLDDLMKRRIHHAEVLIDLRRQKGAAILDDPSLFGEGKQMMDEIRQEIAFLQNDQMSLSAHRIHQAEDVQERSMTLNFWLSIWGTALLFVSAMFLIREKRIRDLAQLKLKNANEMLERVVHERTLQLQHALQRIKKFAMELDENIETERRRLAREVHDQLGQIFTSLKLVMMGVKGEHTPETIKEKVDEIAGLLDEGVNVARRISAELRPALLDDFGLSAAIEHYAEAFTKRGGPAMTIDVSHDSALTPQQANQLFRIFQEAATNVLRHAHAERMWIDGKFENNSYRFTIIDDGVGPKQIRKDASGVRNMRERATLIGGTFEFGPAEDQGTKITVLIPLQLEGDE